MLCLVLQHLSYSIPEIFLCSLAGVGLIRLLSAPAGPQSLQYPPEHPGSGPSPSQCADDPQSCVGLQSPLACANCLASFIPSYFNPGLELGAAVVPIRLGVFFPDEN